MKYNRLKRTVLFVALGCLAMTLTACGYQLIGGKGIYGGEISSIYLGVFKNSTYEPHIGQPVTDSFTRELLLTGLFTVNKASSDAYIQGNITNIATSPSALGTDGVVIEKVVTVEVTAALYKSNGTLIKTFSLSDYEAYKIQNTAEEFNRREAIRRLSARMARRFCAQVMLEY